MWIHISIHIWWIASGLIEKNPFAIHNGAMTSDRHSIAPYPLRLPPELRSSLEAAAKSEGRSLHAEILARLQATAKPEREKLLALADSLATRELEIISKDLEIETLRGYLSYAVFHLSRVPVEDEVVQELTEKYLNYQTPETFFEDLEALSVEKHAAAISARMKLHNRSPILETLKYAAKSLLQAKKKDDPPVE